MYLFICYFWHKTLEVTLMVQMLFDSLATWANRIESDKNENMKSTQYHKSYAYCNQISNIGEIDKILVNSLLSLCDRIHFFQMQLLLSETYYFLFL